MSNKPSGLGLESFRNTNPKRKNAVSLSGDFVRELDASDQISHKPAGQISLAKLRDSHHQIARLLARGLKNHEVSAITGFSPVRISTLRSDSAFIELLEFYRNQADEVNADILGRMKLLSAEALSELTSRIIDNPETMTNRELLELGKLVLDRTGHGAVTKAETKSVEMHLTPEFLKELKGRVNTQSLGEVKRDD